MKRILLPAMISRSLRSCMILSVMLITIAGTPAFSQEDTTQTAAEEKELISPSIDFICIQKGDNSIDLKASIKAKVNGTLTRLYGMKITFISVSDSAEKEIGKVITDRNGTAVFNVKPADVSTDAEGKVHFKAVFAGNKSAEGSDESVSVKRGKLIITPVKEDSLLTIKLKLVDLSTGTETPVPEADLGVFVKRWFNPLKLGEGKTDENGEVTVEIPANLPGDASGNITLMGRLDDNEVYGNMEASVAQPWGTVVSDKIQDLPRSLWSPNPPIWMLVTFIILMVTVWGHYIVIVYELFRLRKEQPKTTNGQ